MEILEALFQLFGNSTSIGGFIGVTVFLSVIGLIVYALV